MLLDQWEILSEAREVPLDVLSRGEPWNVCEAVISLHALADEACSRLSALDGDDGAAFAERAWSMLESRGSLSRFPPSQVRVLPKTLLPAVGITVRSLARYLSVHTSPAEVVWRRGPSPNLTPSGSVGGRVIRILLLPWPLTVRSSDFRPVRGPSRETDAFGFFEFDPHAPLDLGYVRGALRAAQREGGVDIVNLPESSIAAEEIAPLEEAAREFGVPCSLLG
jgi:hypothetical protein